MKVEWKGLRNQKLNEIWHQVNPEPDEEDDPEISVGGAGRAEDNDEDYYDIDETGRFLLHETSLFVYYFLKM